MAREEQDREDILREATALVERAEIRAEGFAETVIFGFRRDGSASFFFGADPVYQFNQQGELRRGYLDGLLIKAENGRLVQLRRERWPGEVALLRSEWDDVRTTAYLKEMCGRLNRLAAALEGDFVSIGEVPKGARVPSRALQWLRNLPERPAIAAAPRL